MGMFGAIGLALLLTALWFLSKNETKPSSNPEYFGFCGKKLTQLEYQTFYNNLVPLTKTPSGFIEYNKKYYAPMQAPLNNGGGRIMVQEVTSAGVAVGAPTNSPPWGCGLP